jgi:hypothetical protein
MEMIRQREQPYSKVFDLLPSLCDRLRSVSEGTLPDCDISGEAYVNLYLNKLLSHRWNPKTVLPLVSVFK